MKQFMMLTLPLVLFLSACATTKKINSPQAKINSINAQTTATNGLTTANSPTCDELLDECATVVEKQQKAINEQQKTISLLDQEAKEAKNELQEEQKSSNLWRGIAIGEAVAIVLLKLLGL